MKDCTFKEDATEDDDDVSLSLFTSSVFMIKPTPPPPPPLFLFVWVMETRPLSVASIWNAECKYGILI